MAAIKEAFDGSRGRYGARKVWHQLRRGGHDIARCTVERLMSAATSSINAKTAARCAAGMAERSMDRAADMPAGIKKCQQKHAKPSG
ncbi:hypothetical protein CCR83_05925 [Rhodobacter veldkampii DSM 11550]|uniref:HTH-like domain-containing protein n=1 Tax=Phaeovulum veldkampii DSM 11550 TaxID=1185920 RepID=A0A2T4J9X1_9RHOB|nr:IS3 family transposase [Phaeovulum veldkampii]MBK5946000.1 hypothetical protein [Phaeovulum veldkampii DSM 11550]PTE14663.1 hypothetical protein C5F46_14580 [Phaeovulum veldkampii DSM 11550]TDQ53511.1 helix-turn-helix protein [Phaeovulum veldkampii DSM 11550]